MLQKFLPLLLAGSCFVTASHVQGQKSSTSAQNPEFTTEYTSLTVPELFHGELSYLDTQTRTTKFQKTDGLKHDKSLLPSFAGAISAVTIYKEDIGGNLSVSGQTLSLNNSNYVVIYDFTQTQQVAIPRVDKSVISGLIGVSVRMTARVHTKKKDINLANLFGIGLAANQNKLTGSLEVKVFGLSSQKINEIIPVTTDLSTGSIQNCLAAVATIKSHMYDNDTFVTPYWLAYNATGSSIPDRENIIEGFRDYSEKFKLQGSSKNP